MTVLLCFELSVHMDWCGQITWQIIPLPTSNSTLLFTVLFFPLLKIQNKSQVKTMQYSYKM